MLLTSELLQLFVWNGKGASESSLKQHESFPFLNSASLKTAPSFRLGTNSRLFPPQNKKEFVIHNSPKHCEIGTLAKFSLRNIIASLDHTHVKMARFLFILLWASLPETIIK